MGSQASEIDDLKLQIEQRETEILDVHSKLALKEDGINRRKSELTTTSELAIATESELKRKSHFIE